MQNRQAATMELINALKRLSHQRQQEEKNKRMNSRDFVYWLQGYLETSDTTDITQSKLLMIRRHLNLAIQTEAEEKHLEQEHARARIRKMHAEADGTGQHSGYHYPQAPAGC
jgi:hypothetical protein